MTGQLAKRHARSGYVLVLFAMMMFVFLGMAALVIDLGYARLTRLQMQTAVDNAALEGLRWRDAPSGSAPLGSARQQASGEVAYLFDDDMNPTNGDTNNFGAGPILQLQGGNDEVPSASQQIVIPATHVYKPTQSDGTPGLELNNNNLPYGDLVAGNYALNSNFQESAGTTGVWSDENDDYSRDDFVASTTASNAFLARMHRTANLGDLDMVPGVSSNGPTLPYLWGRGTMLQSSPTTLIQGITVRATAIAAAADGIQFSGTGSYNAGRAKTAGQPYQYTNPATGTLVGLPGVTPFALTRVFWQSLTPGGSVQITVTSAGALTGAGLPIQTSGILQIGQQIGGSITAGSLATITSAVGSTFYAPSNLYQYVPIYDTNLNNVVIGFGYVPQWSWQVDPTTGGGKLTITLPPAGAQPVGYGNISGTFIPGLPQDTTDYTDLFAANAAFTGGSAYAPVLVDHYIGRNANN